MRNCWMGSRTACTSWTATESFGTRTTGFLRDEVVGRACRDNVLMHVDVAGTSLCLAEFCPALPTIMDGQEREAEVYLHHQDDSRLPVIARISPMRNDSGNITGAVEVFSDNRRMHEMTHRIKELERLALIDLEENRPLLHSQDN